MSYQTTNLAYLPVSSYTRPSDWLTLPAVSVGEEKVVALYAVHDSDCNYVAVNVAGNYNVDWGDGSSENVSTGVQANHNYVYSNINSNTYCSRGYRQVIITITPQAGQHLTTVNLYVKHTAVAAGTTNQYLDIRMAGSNISTLKISGNAMTTAFIKLEQFEFIGTNSVADFSNFFYSCTSLKNVVSLYTGSGTNFTGMFYTCSTIPTIPLLDTSNGLNFTNMFVSCSSLQSIPLLNTAKGTNFSSMFSNCSHLQNIPLLDTHLGQNLSYMFQSCSVLRTIPLINTSAATNMSGMFVGCSTLKTIPLINTSANLTFNSMFNGCTNLRTIPLLNTANGTNFGSMFYMCYSLQTIPLFNTGNRNRF